MSLKKAIQIPSEDGCVYLYDPLGKRWYKFCPVDTLPADVRNTVNDLKEHAELLEGEK